MKIRWSALLYCVVLLLPAACGDGGPSILKQDSDSLVVFKRVTLASTAPDRAEIELEVRTGTNFSKTAPDGTTIVLETSLGNFENNGSTTRVQTIGGHAVTTLILPEPSRLIITASSRNVEARLALDVNEDGSIAIDPY